MKTNSYVLNVLYGGYPPLYEMISISNAEEIPHDIIFRALKFLTGSSDFANDFIEDCVNAGVLFDEPVESIFDESYDEDCVEEVNND